MIPAIKGNWWLDEGHHEDGAVEYVYLNPSQDTWSDGHFNPDVFVYSGENGDPSLDDSHHFYNIFD